MKSPRSSPFDSEVELEDLCAASLAEVLEELPEVHVVPSVPVRIERGLFEAVESAQRLCALARRVHWDVLSVTDHDALPGQNLHPGQHRTKTSTRELDKHKDGGETKPRLNPTVPLIISRVI